MPGPKVFVSFSHRDKRALAQLQRYLRPLEREGLVSAWADTGLEGGADWEQEIEAALASAELAVLLISQDFLASDYIAKKEIPKLLEREAAGGLKILPVFLTPSLVDRMHFPDPRTGGRDKILLSKFQGYGRPEEPLSSLGWPERERIYGELARRLLDTPGTLAAPSAVAPPPAAAAGAATVSAAGPARAFELTVQLEEQGNAILRTYHLPGQEPVLSSSTPAAEAWRRLEPIHQALDSANNRTLSPQLATSATGWGETLFDLIFGPEPGWEPILRAVFCPPPGTRPTPSRFPVRLRIYAEDSRLSGVPWRLTSWKGQPLLDSGWTFATTETLDPRDEPRTPAPCNVLLLVPRIAGDGGGPHDREHAKAVRDVLGKAWPTGRDPGYVQEATTREELESALRNHRPHLLYVYARGIAPGGRPSLLLEGGPGNVPLPLAELRRIFQETRHTPAVLYLNTEGLHDGSGAGPLPTPDQVFADTVPLLLWRRRPEWSADSTTTALRWLQVWLGQGRDPVVALHQLQRESTPPGCEACTVAVHSQARDWHTTIYQVTTKDHHPSLRLDRFHLKSLVQKELEQLVRNSARRVLALVPYASEGNSVELLWKQLQHEVEISLAHLAQIDWALLHFPGSRTNLGVDLEAEVRLQLQEVPGETLTSLLRRKAPRAVAPGRKPVLFLNWGTFGTGAGLQAPLAPEHLAAWLRFSSEILAAHCPPELRVVSYAAAQVPDSDYDLWARRLQEQRRQPWSKSPLFRLSELPPLGRVAESDLLDFLEDPANSSCDQGIQQEVCELIIAETGGAFEETAALLQEAEEGSWYDLLGRLRRQSGSSTAPNEDIR